MADTNVAADENAMLLYANCSIFFLQFLSIAFEINQACAEAKRMWIFNDGTEGKLPQDDPAIKPPPEIAKLGGARGSPWDLRGWWQPGIPPRTLPLEGVLDTLAPQGSISGLSPPRMGRGRLARG